MLQRRWSTPCLMRLCVRVLGFPCVEVFGHAYLLTSFGEVPCAFGGIQLLQHAVVGRPNGIRKRLRTLLAQMVHKEAVVV